MILKDMVLRNKLKKIINETRISDIILFGSCVRGKDNPNDIDILTLFDEKIIKEDEYKVRKEIEKKYENVSIISKTNKTITEESFDARDAVFFEGVSLISGQRIASSKGFTSFGLFRYKFVDWDNTTKTKFYYALNGRNRGVSIGQNLNCIKLSDSVILVPLENIDKFREFLESWKLKFIYTPILIPERMARKGILELIR